jgi:hypothetical protein
MVQNTTTTDFEVEQKFQGRTQQPVRAEAGEAINLSDRRRQRQAPPLSATERNSIEKHLGSYRRSGYIEAFDVHAHVHAVTR